MGKLKDGMARVKKQLSSGPTEPAPKMAKEIKNALELGFTYERVLGEYTHRPALRFFTSIGTEGIKPRTLGALKKAAAIAVSLEVDWETYVRSQFYWFHKWFRRPPRIREMISTSTTAKNNAVWRLREYLKVTKDNQVYSKSIPSSKVCKDQLDKINNQRLDQLADAWEKSHEEIIQIFASSGIFDQHWLEQNDIYCQLINSRTL